MEFTMNPDGSMKPDGEEKNQEEKSGAAGEGPASPPAGPEPIIGTGQPTPGGPLPAADGELIKESNTANFTADVIEASMKVPVIVDFWAPWCGPCKQLGPALEKLVRDAAGMVRLVKINVDENQDLAAQMRIQSIPAVYAFSKGKPVDGFTGALTESQLKSFISKLTGAAKSPTDAALEEAQAALDAGDAAAAGAIFSKVQAQDPANVQALGGLIRVALAMGEPDRAEEIIDTLSPELAQKSEIAAAISAVELFQEGQESGNVAELRGKLEKDENDLQARFDLAMALYAQGQNETAIDELIDIFSRNRKWNDEAARKQLLKIFDALGPTDPLTVSGRKRLSSMLFS